MARLFLSYAREDEQTAAQFAHALEAAAHSVWWDRHVEGGSAYADEIERALRDSEAVIVLWSPASIGSAWVRDEAVEGRDAGKLIPLIIAECKPPLGFRQFQSIDMSTWKGGTVPRELTSAIARIASGSTTSGVPSSPSTPPLRRTICVLPFANLSGDAEQEYFSDGISEDIATDLSKISALSVIAGTTANKFKGKAVDVRELAVSLNVSHVLEGSVRKAGTRLRITAQLVDARTGDQVWRDRYDRELEDIFAIQDELSCAIVTALKLRLLPEERAAIEQRGTTNVQAYKLYLIGRQYWITGNYGDERRDQVIVRILRRVTEVDPGYARAWGLLAIAQTSLCYHHNVAIDDGLEAARTAIRLDPTLAEPYCVMARHCAEQDDFSGAAAEISKGLSLDPNSWEVNAEAARLCMAQRRIEEAATFFEHAVAQVEADFHSWSMLASCYNSLGRAEDARSAAHKLLLASEAVVAKDPLNSAALASSAAGFAILGQRDNALERVERAILIDPDNVNTPYNIACVLLVWLDDKKGALDLLEPLFAKVSRALVVTAMADPELDTIRDDPRFKKMAKAAMQRTGLR